MPDRFDKYVGIHKFLDGPMVGSQNKFPTKVSFLDGLLEEFGQESDEVLKQSKYYEDLWFVTEQSTEELLQ